MTTIYYLLGIIFIWKELMWIVQPKAVIERLIRFDELKKLEKEKALDGNTKEEYNKIIWTTGLGFMISFFWLILGVFTVQWFSFLIIMIFKIGIIAPISKPLKKESKGYLYLHWINSLIGLAFGFFVIINHYHLHIDTWELIKQFYN